MLAPGAMLSGPPKQPQLLRLSQYIAALEIDPDDPEILAGIRRIIADRDSDLLGDEPERLLELARQSHELRGEYATVARLIDAEIQLVAEDRLLAASLYKELGRLRAEYLLDPSGAKEAYDQALAHKADDPEVLDALRRLEQAEASWKKFARRFVEEAESATDVSLKASLLLRAACLAWENRRKGKSREVDRLFAKVLEIDPGNLRAALLYEHTLREREEWKDLAQHLLDTAEVVRDKQDRVPLFLRAARVLARRLHDKNRATACYERVLEAEPGNAEAMAFLTERFTENQQWDHLVTLYENALRVPQKLDVEQDILVQLGTVHHKMRGRPGDAEPYFARLRKLDAAHPVILEFYRSYLREQGDLERLLRVLLDAQRVVGEPPRRVALAVEAAQLAQSTQGMGERAIEAWKSVQRLDPHNAEAARVLKELYAKSEKWNALVEVLKTQIDSTPDSQLPHKVELLRELAIVYRDRLRLDGMLINAYNAILRLDPHDRETLDALANKYRELGRWNDLINVLIWDAEASADIAHRVAIYLQVAQLWLEHFSNYNQASGPLEKVIELEPHNREALSLLRDIYERKRAWRPLFEVLKKERTATDDPVARTALTIQLAALAADRLHRYEDAVALFREVAADEGQAERALDAIEKLAEREKDWNTLADVLEKQAARQTGPDDRIRLLLKLGGLYADRLSDPDGAGRVWRRILEIDPRQGRALRSLRDALVAQGEWDALEILYERANDFEGLVDVLSSEADRATARDLKVDLSLRVARIFEGKIGEPARAQRSYERVLAVDPENVRAARALAPIYEHEEKWARLCAMLDIVLRSLNPDDRVERLALLARLRTLSQERVRDSAAAFEYALRSYELSPADEAARAALESSAEAAQAFERVVEAYRARAEVADSDEALLLWRRIAAIANLRLARSDLATSYSERVLELCPTDAAALAALDSIYRTENRPRDIRRLLAHRLEHESATARRWELLKELAVLEEEQLHDVDAAANRYRAMAEVDPSSHEVWATLDRLALAAGRYDELATVLDRRRELAGVNNVLRVELGARLAALILEQQQDPERALGVYGEVLELDPAHGASVEALETMAATRAALGPHVFAVLEKAYERVGRYDKLAAILKQRLLESRDEAEIRRLRLRSAEISGSQLGDALGAYAALEAAFLEEPHDTSLWERLSEAAERAGQHRALASAFARVLDRPSLAEADSVELSARIASIYEEILSEPHEAEPFHKRVLAHDPSNERGFVALKELYTTEERWEDLQVLYRKRIEDTVDAQTKLDLLLQVCFLFEEILEQPDKAIDAYRAVLELSPDHAPSRRTLERLYERRERHRDLAGLLKSNLDHASGYDQVDTFYRLGELYEAKLGEPGLAVDHYEGVLQRQPHHLRAQAALGRLLAIEGLRQRVAAILEPMYESQGAYADLARVLEIQLADREGADGKADLLLRIGNLYETRLRDPESAFAAYARAVETLPADRSAREALARMAANREVFRKKRALVLEQAVQKVEDPDTLIELLSELAELQLDYLEDNAAAERCYLRLVELAEGRDDVVLTASRALERIHTHAGDHAALAVDLSRQADLELDAQFREQLLVRLAELYERKLSNVPLAIDAQRKRLELDPSRSEVLRALERLYESAARYEELVEVLQRRRDLSEDGSERHALGRRIASVIEEKLGDVARGIEAHRENVALFGPDRETLAALSRLYESAGRHAELLETLESEIEFAPDGPACAALRFRMAELLGDKLGEPERAIAAYEAALEDDPTHAGCLAALEAIAQDTGSPYRRDAARAAAPHYEALSRFDKLLAMLELLAQTDDEADKLAALRRAAHVAETGQKDFALAMSYIGRALRFASSHDSLPDLLHDYAGLAQLTGRYADYVACLQEIAPNIFDGDQRVRVYREIASAAQDKLADIPLARASYRLALEEQPDDVSVLDALLKLDEEAADYPALIDVIGRKAALTVDPKQRARLLEKQADVYERGLDDSAHAIAALEEVIADQPLESAFVALERLYQRSHRYGDLAQLYENQLDRGIGKRVEVRYRLAKTYRQHMNDNHASLAQLREAIDEDSNHADSIALLESIMSEHGECRALAAEVLEPGYLARMEWAKLTSALRARVEVEPELLERKRLLVRLARIYEDQLEDYDETLEIFARLFREDFRDEEVWERLTRLAKVGGQWSRLAKTLGEPLIDAPVEDEIMARLARYVGSLYDERAVNLVKAAEFYAKALAFDREDAIAFRALESAYRRGSHHAALLELYTQQAEVAANDASRVELLHKRARVQLDDVGDKPSAAETYREILEIAPGDRVAVDALELLLTEAEDWKALSEHLRWRIDHEQSGKQELDLKHRLALLSWSKLSDETAAIDLWEEIIGADPTHAAALDALEQSVQEERHRLRVTEILEPVYRHRDQWKKLIAIHEARLLLVTDPDEVTRLLSEVGELHEKRASDAMRALHAYARAFARDPENEVLRAHVDRLASRTNAWSDHVTAYEAAFAVCQNDATKLQLLTMIARVQDEKRGDPRAAIFAYERFLAIEPDDAGTLDALESLHTMVADWRGLIAILERKVVTALGGEERAEVLRRIGSVYEELVADRDAAIDAYQRAVVEFEADEIALEALDRLYGANGRAVPLFETLKRRIELAQDPPLRAELGLRLGFLADVRLHQTDEAVAAYRRVLDDDPSNATAIAHLCSLYERLGMWHELLDNLRLQISLATTAPERVGLRCRAGHVLLQKLFDVPEAIESYREALQEDSSSSEALSALMELTLHEEHRMRAAEVIEPLLREGERWDELVTLVERKLAGLSEPSERREELVGLAAIHELGRSDKSAAFEALARAVAEDPGDVELQDDLERIAGTLSAFDRLCTVLVERAAVVSDPAQAGELLRRAGRVAETELADDSRAIEAYKLASARDDDSPETLEALDRLYMKTERWEPLLDVLERRIAATTSRADRATPLLRLGELRERRFNDGRGAFVAYQEVLDNDPSDARALSGMTALGERDELTRDVLDVLERCYRETRAIAKVVELYDLRVKLAPSDSEKARLLREAAGIWERDLAQPRRALESMRRAFELDPDDFDVLDDMERLASAASAWPLLGGLAETVIAGHLLDNSAKRDLALRAAGWYREFMTDPEGEERCLVAVLLMAPDELTVHARVLELVRDRGDRRALLSALRAFALVDDDEERRTSHLHEAGALALELADTAAANHSFERILDSNPDDTAALSALADLRAAEGRHAEAVQLLSRWLAVEVDPKRRLVLHHTISNTLLGPLDDSDGAIAAFRDLREEFPSDSAALAALELLYERAERWDDLEQLLAAELGEARSLPELVGLRLRMARLYEERLDQPAQALEQLRAVLVEDPDQPQAGLEFERLLAMTGSVTEQAEWRQASVDRALAGGDTARAVEQLWRLAELYEGAQRETVLLRIHELSATDRRALEALIALYQEQGNAQAAARFLELLLPLQEPAAAIVSAYALAELAEQQLADQGLVERSLQHALALDPARTETRTRLRKHLTATGAFDKLAQLLEAEVELLAVPTEQAALLREVAKLHASSLGDPAGAVTRLERAVRLVPDDRDALLALCDLYVAAGRSVDAIPVLEKIIASYGGRRAKEVAVFEHRLGHAYEGMGRLDDALKHYDNAFKIDLTSVPVLRDLGRLCLARGDLDRAQKTYRALLLQKLGADLGITKSEVYFRLGEISAAQGDKVKAKAMLERAISEAGQHPGARALLDRL
jgi:tetratricopeptide (TPR) repeat protein